MADQPRIHGGLTPWQPTEYQTRLIAEYHRYDIPLLGVIEQSGSLFLFQCLTGEVEQLSIWAYTPLSAEEKARLDILEGEEFEGLVESVTDRPGTAALAVEGWGIIATYEVADWSDPDEAVDSLLSAFATWSDNLTARARSSIERALVG